MTTPRHSVSVAAVVTDERGRILVIQRRDNGAWQLPGGVLELDETVDAGVRREVKEETGMNVEPLELSGVYKNMKLGVIALVFRARVIGGAPQISDESAAVDWWTTEQVEARMDETFAVRIFDALAPEPHTAIRHHDGTRILPDLRRG